MLFALTAGCVVLCAVLGIWTATVAGDAARLTPEPFYTVCNRWYGESGKKENIVGRSVTQRTVYQTALADRRHTGEYLTVKSKNLGLTAYTGGKILFYRAPESGVAFSFIPVGELDEGGTVVLQLEPVNNKSGMLLDNIVVSNKNDYLLTLLVGSRRTVLTALCLLLALTAVMTVAAVKIKGKQRSGFGILYLAVFLALCFVVCILRSDLAAFLIGSVTGIAILRHTLPLLLPIPLLAFTVSRVRLSRSSPGPSKRP
ncbi:MAG: hypothetical protein IJ168_01815 [Eubacterium sp.]|nr:hypothetical protein [Eubacterium sp.]